MSTPEGLYLDAELFILTAQRHIHPRARVVSAGEPFAGFGLRSRGYRCGRCGRYVKVLSVWSGERRAHDAGQRGDCRNCGLDVPVNAVRVDLKLSSAPEGAP